jgi:hypothetical protein
VPLGANTIFEVRTTGSDTANGGAFDPGQTAGMLTDGAATSATGSSPVFSSASYNFVAGDVGAWVYIASGTNWTPGWYQIASVASNQATLSAAIGAAVLATSGRITTASTVAGCATAASPTGATWTVDYSQQASARYSYTDLASAGAGLTVSSAATPFTQQMVGNGLIVASGTNFTAGVYVIASVSGGVATVVGAANITTGAGASGVGGQGGAFLTFGKPAGIYVAGNSIWLLNGTYSVTSTITLATTGAASNPVRFSGYTTVRTDRVTRTILTTATNSVAILTLTAIDFFSIENFSFTTTASTKAAAILGLTTSGGLVGSCSLTDCLIDGFTVGVDHGSRGSITSFTRTTIRNCSSHGISFGLSATANIVGCLIYANSGKGFYFTNFSTGVVIFRHTVLGNNGAEGFYDDTTNRANKHTFSNCTISNNTGSGIRIASSSANNSVSVCNCIFYGNGVNGVNSEGTLIKMISIMSFNFNNFYGANTSGARSNFPVGVGDGELTANPFTNAGSGDYSLNNTAGGGAACRAAGYPGAFPGATTTGYLDIGAVQHQDAGGGGGSVAFSTIGRMIG